MSYINQNQTSTFRKLLLSTAVISSVVCSSSGVLAMDSDEWETPISQRRIKSDQAIVNLMYKSSPHHLKVYNGILFEWSENYDKKAALVHYEEAKSIFSTAGTVATKEAPNVANALEAPTYFKMTMEICHIASRVAGTSYSVKGVAHSVRGIPNIEDYIKKQNWQIVSSWTKSAEDVKQGIHKAEQILQDPPPYSLHAHLPYVDVYSKVHNSLTISAALLYSSGIKQYHNIFVAASPRTWTPQAPSDNIITTQTNNRLAEKVEKSLHDDKFTNFLRYAVAVEQEGEGLHDLANHNYHLSLGEEADKDFRSSSNND